MNKRKRPNPDLYYLAVWLGIIGFVAYQTYQSVVSDSGFNIHVKTLEEIVHGNP